MRNTPASDLQKNVKALLTQQFARLELVTREEFDTQTKVLAKTRATLEGLERRLTEIENKNLCAEVSTRQQDKRQEPWN